MANSQSKSLLRVIIPIPQQLHFVREMSTDLATIHWQRSSALSRDAFVIVSPCGRGSFSCVAHEGNYARESSEVK